MVHTRRQVRFRWGRWNTYANTNRNSNGYTDSATYANPDAISSAESRTQRDASGHATASTLELEDLNQHRRLRNGIAHHENGERWFLCRFHRRHWPGSLHVSGM
jgi:hypothetical protein